MDYALKIFASFVVGGGYVAGVVWLSERLGSRIGGAVAGLPSTILVSLSFIAITEGPADARSAVSIAPLMFIATLIYALVFMQAVKKSSHARKHPIAITLATLAWLAAAIAIRQLSSLDFYAVVLLATLGLAAFLYKFRDFSVIVPNKIPLPKHMYALRFFVGGVLIASAVVAARFLGPVWGGIISSFPVMLGSILYFLNKSQGAKFLEGFLRRLPLSYGGSLLFMIIIHQTLTKTPAVLSFALGLSGAAFYAFILLSAKQRADK
ncbi:MAG: hypothetical protein JWO47_872 [Candidatus Saccharibacteria bacterium]|nr:hypothetical protein [Candidatus Saccharibacteria bacterium]